MPSVSLAAFTSPTKTAPTISATITDATSGVKQAEYWVVAPGGSAPGAAGTGTNLPLSSGSTYSTVVPSFSGPDGTYTVYVDAQDNAGNWSAKVSKTFVKDTIAPVIAASYVSASPTATPPQITAYPITDANPVTGADYFLDIDPLNPPTPGTGTPLTVYQAYNNQTQQYYWEAYGTPSSVADGPHTIYVEARDGAGNWSALSSVAFIEDSQIPSVSLAGPTIPSYLTGTNASPINFTATFSVPVALVNATKIVPTGGSVGVPSSDSTGKVWTIPVTPTVNPTPQTGETVSLQLNAGAFQSANLNYLGAHDPSPATSQVTVTFDDVAPVMTGAAFVNTNYPYPAWPAGTVLVPNLYTYLDLTFNENVVVHSSPGPVAVQLNNGMTLNYSSGSGTSTIVFAVTVPSGQTSSVPLDLASITPFTGGTLTDAAGNPVVIPTPSSSNALSSQNITVHPTDDVPPVTTVTGTYNYHLTYSQYAISPSASGWFSYATVYVALSASAFGTYVTNTYYQVTDPNGTVEAQQTYNSSNLAAVGSTAAGNGTYTLAYWSVDNAGNTESKHTLAINIDTTSPTLTVNEPPNTIYGVPITVTGTWTAGPSGLSATAPLTLSMDDQVTYPNANKLANITNPSWVINPGGVPGTWSYTFTALNANGPNNANGIPIEGPYWHVTVYATSGANKGGTAVSSNYGGNTFYPANSSPTVTFSAPGGSGTTATGTVVLSDPTHNAGYVVGVNIVNPGSGYTSPPTMTFSYPGGYGATGTFTLNANGGVVSVNMTPFSISKATPTTLNLNPVNITYGTALANSQLSTETAMFGTTTVAGTFSYTSANPVGTILNADNSQTEQVTFTPTDTTDYTTVNGTVTVNVAQATLHVVAEAETKVSDGPDPMLTYTYTTSDLKYPDTKSVFTGSLTRVSGEDPGTYAIQQGSLSAGSNYTIAFTGANLTILGDVTPQFNVVRSALMLNRTTGNYTGTITLTNNTATAISGPLVLVLSGLSPSTGVTLVSTSSSTTGVTVTKGTPSSGTNLSPYVQIGLAQSLAPGQSITISVTFNKLVSPTTYTPKVYAGTLLS